MSELHEERCMVCGERIAWDDTPDPICDECSEKERAAKIESRYNSLLAGAYDQQPIGLVNPRTGSIPVVHKVYFRRREQ